MISPGWTQALPEGKPRERYLEMICNFIKFSQENGLMQRVLLKKKQKAHDLTYVVTKPGAARFRQIC